MIPELSVFAKSYPNNPDPVIKAQSLMKSVLAESVCNFEGSTPKKLILDNLRKYLLSMAISISLTLLKTKLVEVTGLSNSKVIGD